MNGTLIPLVLTFAGFITAIAAYRGIRRGGARYYTLEREAILRRATLSLAGSVLLFLTAIGLLLYERQQIVAETNPNSGDPVEGLLATTSTPSIEQFPPMPTETPTPDLSIPTATPTPIICRAVVQSVNGLRLRDTPGGEEIDILPDGSILTLVTSEPPTEVNGIVWRKVRPVIGDEGWVAAEFIIVGAPCE
jgi:hypothetical protein